MFFFNNHHINLSFQEAEFDWDSEKKGKRFFFEILKVNLSTDAYMRILHPG